MYSEMGAVEQMTITQFRYTFWTVVVVSILAGYLISRYYSKGSSGGSR